MSTVYGLPRYVATFLRHMEAYKDLLKWNITEGSHKITLTLSWNFQQQKAGGAGARLKAALWDKVQRTLKLTSQGSAGAGELGSGARRPTNLPEELTKFLDASTIKRRTPTGNIKRTLSLHSPFKRQLSWSRYSALTMSARASLSRSQSNPITSNHVGHNRQSSKGAGNATSTFSSSHNPSPIKAHPQSPSRYSWPGTSLDVENPILHSTPNHSLRVQTPSTPQSTPLSSPNLQPSIVRYRDVSDIHSSMEDMMAKARQDNRERLREIQQEWHAAVTHWDEVMAQDSIMLNSSTESGSEPPIPTDTVLKCLDSCDKILGRHSTDV